MLTEILVLFGIGAVGAVAIAFAATTWATRFPLPADIIVPPDLVPDGRVMAFALLVSLATGVVFGLTPALRASRDDVSARLRDGSSGAGTRRGWAGNALIVGQLALSLVLLVAAGLFVRALSVAARVDVGFDRSGIAVVSFDSRVWGYDEARGRRFYHELGDRVCRAARSERCDIRQLRAAHDRSMNDSLTLSNGERVFIVDRWRGRRLLQHAAHADRRGASVDASRRRARRASRGRQRDIRQAARTARQCRRTDVHARQVAP